MIFHTPQKRNIPKLYLAINNTQIEQVNHFDFLGIVDIGSKLSRSGIIMQYQVIMTKRDIIACTKRKDKQVYVEVTS